MTKTRSNKKVAYSKEFTRAEIKVLSRDLKGVEFLHETEEISKKVEQMSIIDWSEKYNNGNLGWNMLTDDNWFMNPYKTMSERTNLSPIPLGKVYCYIDFLEHPYCEIKVSGTNLNAIVKGGVGLKAMDVGDCFLFPVNGDLQMILITDITGSSGFLAEGFLFSKCKRNFSEEEIKWISQKTEINSKLLIHNY